MNDVEKELKSLVRWAWSQKDMLGAVDGYDYDSGQEYAFRRFISEIETRITEVS